MRVTDGPLRVKLSLAGQGRLILVTLLVVAVLAFAGAAVAYANPPTTEVSDSTHRQTVSTDLRTSALVTGENDLYERGQRLEEQPVYLLSVAPNMTVELQTVVPDDATVRVTHEVWLRYSAHRDGSIFWQRNESVASGTTAVTDGATVLAGTIRVPDVETRAARFHEQLDRVGDLDVSVHARVEYDTGRYEGELTGTAPLSISDRAYWLDGDLEDDRDHSTTIRERQIDEGGVVRAELPGIGGVTVPHVTALLGGGGVICLLAAVWIVSFLRRDVDEATLRDRLHELRYDEWISTGQIPHDVGDYRVQIRSLEELVDVAIDSAKRVIWSPERGMYAVIDGDTVYYFRPDAFPSNPAGETGSGDDVDADESGTHE